MANEMNVEAERSAFEAWARNTNQDYASLKGADAPGGWYYFEDDAHAAWAAWQAARRAAQPADVGAAELPQAAQGVKVKTWQERCDWWSERSSTKLMVEAMKAEIAELRALLAAPPLSSEPQANQPEIPDSSVGSAPAEHVEPSPMYFDALKIVREQQRASVSLVQRRLRISWDAARDMVELMLSRRDVPLEWAPPVYQLAAHRNRWSSKQQAEKGGML